MNRSTQMEHERWLLGYTNGNLILLLLLLVFQELQFGHIFQVFQDFCLCRCSFVRSFVRWALLRRSCKMDCTFGCCTTTSSSPPRENSFQTLHQIWTEVSRLLLLPGKEELLMTFHLERKKKLKSS